MYHKNSNHEQHTHLELDAPSMRDGRYVLGANLTLSSGDKIHLEAEITPETIQRARAGGRMVMDRLARWMRERVTLRGDWASYGPMARAVAGVAMRTARHPYLNLPVLSHNEDDKSHPAYSVACDLLHSNDLSALRALKLRAAKHDCRNDYRELLAGCAHYGNCCCGKKTILSCYDAAWLMDHPWADPSSHVAEYALDQQLLRSYRALPEGGGMLALVPRN